MDTTAPAAVDGRRALHSRFVAGCPGEDLDGQRVWAGPGQPGDLVVVWPGQPRPLVGASDASFREAPFMVFTIPLTVGGFGLGAILFGWTLNKHRLWYSLAIAALLGGSCALLKTPGARGNFSFDLSWRWQETAEDRFLAKRSQEAPTKNEAIDDTATTPFAN